MIADVMSYRCLDVTVDHPLPALPRPLRIAREQAVDARYRHRPAHRPFRMGAVQITLAGRGALWPDGDASRPPLPLPVGSALLFITGGEHRCAYGWPPGGDGPWDFVYADLAGEAALAIIRDLVARGGHRLALDPGHAVVRDLLARLPAAGERDRRLSAAEAMRLAGDLLAALAEGLAGPTPSRDRALVENALRWLRARLDRRVTMAEMAADLGASREHLARAFAAQVGMPPATWLRRARLDRAVRLLRAGDHAVATVASACGYRARGHFAGLVRRHAGQVPRRLRGA